MLVVQAMKSFIIGTAGHVDHGKTALVRALTGIDTDRLPEEKRRGMSIELGYAPLVLSEGSLTQELTAGIVDVPGHENLVRTMIMGATQIDLALFMVAANEGMKPQSREHLTILSLLGLKRALLVITKSDLIEKEKLPSLVEAIRKEAQGTFLENAPVIFTSLVNGEGIEALKEEIRKQATSILFDHLAQTRANQSLRIPIDRVFSLPGFGTVVTGPLLFGSVSLEEKVEIFPIGKKAFVRRLHAYGKEVSSLQAPSRVALNLRGVSREELKRGDLMGKPNTFKPVTKAIAQIKFLKENHNLSQCIFHSGTTKTSVWIKKDPKSQNYFLKFLDPLILQPEDPFILRTHTTLGGGKIVQLSVAQTKSKQPPQEPAKEKIAIQAQEVLKLFHAFWNESLQPLEIDNFKSKLKYTAEEFHLILKYLIEQKKVIRLPKGLYLPYERYDLLKEKMSQFFKNHSELHVTDVKTLFQLSRKHAIPYLEFFDQEKWTLRKGDVRLPWLLK